MEIISPARPNHITDNAVPEILSTRSPLPPIDKWENV